MSREIHGAPLFRCLAVWSLTTASTSGVLLGLGPQLDSAQALAAPAARSGVPFDSLLVSGAAVALCVCTVWLWALTTLVVVQAMTGRLRSLRGCPDGVRRLVLAACGLALAATAAPATAAPATAAPATADPTTGHPPAPDDSSAISGLPLPDRVALGAHASRPPGVMPAEKHGTHVVTRGDTLWGIAADSLAGPAPDADIDRRWRAIWAANRSEIGPDPDRIHPGTTLHLPLDKEY